MKDEFVARRARLRPLDAAEVAIQGITMFAYDMRPGATSWQVSRDFESLERAHKSMWFWDRRQSRGWRHVVQYPDGRREAVSSEV